MSIKFDEVSGISEDDFNKIFNSELGIIKSIEIYRENPIFESHDLSGLSSRIKWDSATNDDYIVMAYITGSALHVRYLALESNNSESSNSWSDQSIDTVNPSYSVVINKTDTDDFWLYYVNSDNEFTKGIWIPSGFSSSEFSTVDFTDYTIPFMDVTEDDETVYIVIDSTTGNRKLYNVDSSSIIDLGIYWSVSLNGFSVQKFSSAEDDTSGQFDNSDIRHCILISSNLPQLYQEKLLNNVPYLSAVNTGGIVSIIIRPKLDDRPVQVSPYYDIHTFDQLTSIQYRDTVKVWKDSQNILWLSTVGKDGDLNGSDLSYNYYAMYYYSSKDGKNWSQNQIIPIDDMEIIGDLGNLSQGVQISSLGNYTYAITAVGMLRTLGCGQFGNIHPDLRLDISDEIESYSSSISDVRQTSIEVNNSEGQLYNTFLNDSGTFRLITKFGKTIDGIDYLFQTSIEEVDDIDDISEWPRVFRISSRDLMSLITDKTTAVDAIQYDNIQIGLDTFDAVGDAQDAGLSHTSVVQGTFGTTNIAGYSTLDLKSKYVTGLTFNTQISGLVDNGFVSTEFSFPVPTGFGGTNSTDSPTFSGVIFRALDKDNYWFVKYNYWTSLIEIGEVRGGTETIYHTQSPDSEYIDAVNGGQFASLRVEYIYNKIRVWTGDASNNSIFNYLFQYEVYGQTSPLLVPVGRGHAGLIGSGYSDEDIADQEPDSSIILPEGSDFSFQNAVINSGTGRIAFVNISDRNLYRTFNWDSELPNWEQIVLTYNTTDEIICQFVSDPNSPLYRNTGTAVNGWIATTKNFYRIENIFGSVNITHQYTFPDQDISRDFDTSFGTLGWIVVLNYLETSITCDVSRNAGVTWSHTIISTLGSGKGLYISHKTAGLIMVGGQNVLGHGCIYISTDYGQNWIQPTSSPIIAEGISGVSESCSYSSASPTLHVPYNANPTEKVMYYLWSYDCNLPVGQEPYFTYRNDANGYTYKDVTPYTTEHSGDRPYGVQDGIRGMYSHLTNRNTILMVGRGWYIQPGVQHYRRELCAIFGSKNAGTNWTLIGSQQNINSSLDSTLPTWTGCAISGDDENTIYTWGSVLNFSKDFGVTIQDKYGDFAVHSVDLYAINICGG